MYYNGRISVDPSQLTNIELIKPDKGFKKLFNFLTAGSLNEKQETETFTAVGILQNLKNVFEAIGIDNVVRLSQDDIDFYVDTAGKENDLQEAMDRFVLETSSEVSQFFDHLYLVLEHRQGSFHFLIEIAIHRHHKVGEYPIIITLNGLLLEFEAKEGEDSEALKKRLEPTFASQESYDQFIRMKETEFEQFVRKMEQNLKQYIKVDDLVVSYDARMLAPKNPVRRTDEIRHSREAPPVYHGYAGTDSLFLYGFLWYNMLHDHNIEVSNIQVMDEMGSEVMHIGNEAINVGGYETDAFYDMAEDTNAGWDAMDIGADEATKTGWFDFSDSSDFGDMDMGGFD